MDSSNVPRHGHLPYANSNHYPSDQRGPNDGNSRHSYGDGGGYAREGGGGGFRAKGGVSYHLSFSLGFVARGSSHTRGRPFGPYSDTRPRGGHTSGNSYDADMVNCWICNKTLPKEKFSNNALKASRKGKNVKCKNCTSTGDAPLICSCCNETKAKDKFTGTQRRNQYPKCRKCSNKDETRKRLRDKYQSDEASDDDNSNEEQPYRTSKRPKTDDAVITTSSAFAFNSNHFGGDGELDVTPSTSLQTAITSTTSSSGAHINNSNSHRYLLNSRSSAAPNRELRYPHKPFPHPQTQLPRGLSQHRSGWGKTGSTFPGIGDLPSDRPSTIPRGSVSSTRDEMLECFGERVGGEDRNTKSRDNWGWGSPKEEDETGFRAAVEDRLEHRYEKRKGKIRENDGIRNGGLITLEDEIEHHGDESHHSGSVEANAWVGVKPESEHPKTYWQNNLMRRPSRLHQHHSSGGWGSPPSDRDEDQDPYGGEIIPDTGAGDERSLQGGVAAFQ